MANVNITEQIHRVTVQEDGSVHVASVGIKGPKGDKGDPGDADMGDVDAHMAATTDVHGIADSAELATLTDLANVEIDTSTYDDHLLSTEDVHGILDTAVLETQSGAQSRIDDHNAATNVHGIDTTQLATQDDLANLEPLPEPGDDGDVLTLADGEPTWAAPEGGGGGDIHTAALPWVPGKYYDSKSTIPYTIQDSNYNITANRIYFVPIYVPVTRSIDRIGSRVRSAGSEGTTFRLGLYNVGDSGLPDTLLIDAGELPADTIGGKEITIDIELAGGTWYWGAFFASDVFETIGWANTNIYNTGNDTVTAGSVRYGYLRNLTYGSLPDSAGSVDALPQHVPYIRLRAV